MKRKANEKLLETKNAASRIVPWVAKFSIDEAHELTKKVLHFAKGKRSLYIRAAVLAYKPRKEDFK